MTDTEKIKLIDGILADFWEVNDCDQTKEGALYVLTAIGSVVNFKLENKQTL